MNVKTFWSRIKIDASDKCWEWQGHTDEKGRGRYMSQDPVTKKNKPYISSRLAWTLTNGEVPQGLCVLHRCDNPLCCNPSHLFLGTKGDNNRDRANKGRSNPVRGEAKANSRLTEEQVKKIRALHTTGQYSQPALGEMFGVSRGCIEEVVTFRTWKHVHNHLE